MLKFWKPELCHQSGVCMVLWSGQPPLSITSPASPLCISVLILHSCPHPCTSSHVPVPTPHPYSHPHPHPCKPGRGQHCDHTLSQNYVEALLVRGSRL